MGLKYDIWNRNTDGRACSSYDEVISIVKRNRNFKPHQKLVYDDSSLQNATSLVADCILANKKIALYSDYDVDGVMSCASWIWFFKAISYTNYTYYIPDRFQEGYGVNRKAIEDLVKNQGVELVISMDTGITARDEVELCKSLGAQFVCTDHHSVQEDMLPDCDIVNPKLYHDDYYRDLCGCGISFIFLRKLSITLLSKTNDNKQYELTNLEWKDILALVGIATVCDIVPLNGANHSIVKLGLAALSSSRRDILVKLKEICGMDHDHLDEKDVGFTIGPRINAVGRVDRVSNIMSAFISEDYTKIENTIEYMNKCNSRRKHIQDGIFNEVKNIALSSKDEDFLFVGGSSWHHGVVGIVASKIVNDFFKPTFVYCEDESGVCTGSVRSIPGINVVDAFGSIKDLLIKYGGHSSAGGFSFKKENKELICDRLKKYFSGLKSKSPNLWQTSIDVDCSLHFGVIDTRMVDKINELKPFGFGFREPVFEVAGTVGRVEYYNDKKTGKQKHTVIFLRNSYGFTVKLLFFNEIIQVNEYSDIKALVTLGSDIYKGTRSVNLYGVDIEIDDR